MCSRINIIKVQLSIKNYLSTHLFHRCYQLQFYLWRSNYLFSHSFENWKQINPKFYSFVRAFYWIDFFYDGFFLKEMEVLLVVLVFNFEPIHKLAP